MYGNAVDLLSGDEENYGYKAMEEEIPKQTPSRQFFPTKFVNDRGIFRRYSPLISRTKFPTFSTINDNSSIFNISSGQNGNFKHSLNQPDDSLISNIFLDPCYSLINDFTKLRISQLESKNLEFHNFVNPRIEEQSIIDDLTMILSSAVYEYLVDDSIDKIDSTRKIYETPLDTLAIPKTNSIKFFDGSILTEKLKCLISNNWLNDEVINSYITLLRRFLEMNRVNYYIFNTFFYEKLTQNTYRYGNVSRWTKKFNIFNFDKILIPIHEVVHWTIVEIDLKNQSITYYDSLGSSKPFLSDILLHYLQDEHYDKLKQPYDISNFHYKSGTCPCQENGYDCGVFMLMNMEFICRNMPLSFTQNQMSYFRKRILFNIINVII